MDRAVLHVLAMLLVIAGVRGNCPSDLSRRIQQCTDGATAAAASSIRNLTQVETFCHKGVEEAMKCVNMNIELCAQSPQQKEVLDMLINVDSMTRSLRRFCDNVDILVKKSSCLRHLSKAGSCVLQIAEDFQYRVSGTTSAKRMMDLTCGFFDDMTECFVSPFPENCKDVAGLYGSLLQANRFPYCGYSQEEKMAAAAKLEQIRLTGFAAIGGSGSISISWSLSFLFLLVSLSQLRVW